MELKKKEFIDRLAQTREQHGRHLFSDRFGDGLEGYKLLERIIQCRV